MINAASALPTTKFFTGCRGVFQGGGCRAAAHVGAYEAASECGVRFSEVAGTSAGSIIAALIGAGASPSYLREKIQSVDFSRFLLRPDPVDFRAGWMGAICRTWPLSTCIKLSFRGKILLYGGAYSSSEIEVWINELLGELLPAAAMPVKFSDLIVPTSIVSTDLGSGTAKVWSVASTPNDSVALAVRSSCSIPGFFQPVKIGNTRHVDGGLLSNLPSFIFSQSNNSRSPGGRVLGFSLADRATTPEEWNVKTLVSRLIDTVVGGATELQNRTQAGVNIISIPTGDIKSTDFARMNGETLDNLSTMGRNSTIEFIRNEGVELLADTQKETIARDVDDLHAHFVREASDPGIELIISDHNSLWYWSLFPTILAWRISGAKVRVYLTAETEVGQELKKEQQRRTMLAGIGADISIVPSLPWRGMLIRRPDNHDAVFVKNENKSQHAHYASMYWGNSHKEVIEALYNWQNGSVAKTNPNVITLSPCPPDELIARLKRGVRQYVPSKVTISSETIDISNVSMINRRVRAFKLAQIGSLAEAYRRFDIPLFSAAEVKCSARGNISTITPPVIEEWGHTYVALEGNTRILYAHLNGIKELQALIVRNVSDELPGRPVEPRRVLMVNRVTPSDERIAGFNFDRFRSIERAARPLIGDYAGATI